MRSRKTMNPCSLVGPRFSGWPALAGSPILLFRYCLVSGSYCYATTLSVILRCTRVRRLFDRSPWTNRSERFLSASASIKRRYVTIQFRNVSFFMFSFSSARFFCAPTADSFIDESVGVVSLERYGSTYIRPLSGLGRGFPVFERYALC